MASDRSILPKQVRPVDYNLFIHDIELGGNFTYHGEVIILLDVLEKTKSITLNALQLVVESAAVDLQGKKIEASSISYEEGLQRMIISFDEEIVPPKATLTIVFKGTVNNLMAGFYRSRYKPKTTSSKSVPRDDEFHYMYSTQFESCDARRAFPCFDEPNLKATFEVRIEIPGDLLALSNMPVADVKPTEEDRKIIIFERTPKMSTYLLAWAVGDFEYVETFTQRKYNGKYLPVRVYTTRGLKEQGQFALKHAHQIVDYFSDTFGIEYPLPKVDLLAVHEFSHGAMENWGLITYRTTAVLFDETQSDQKYKNRVTYVVAHELAHQWFGNLVTMDWWNELWLNEGFATWVGWLAVDHLYPEWDIWSQFVTESLQTAFQLDSLRSSHPIEVPVRDALEVDQIFDHISYLKGSSVIRMLSAHLSVDVFLRGVSDYLKAHAYGNATTDDLWSALSKASGQDVAGFMEPWIKRMGFPVVAVAEEPGQISLRQSRFLSTGDVKPEDDETTWWIPLGLKTGPKAESVKSVALKSKSETVRDLDESFYKINANQNGFFRTNYPPARLMKLGSARDKLTNEDKIGLVGDAAALATSGEGTTAGLLGLVEGFQDEQNYLVWAQILTSLGNVRSVFAQDEDISKALRFFTLKLVAPATERVGWDFGPTDDFLTIQLRALLIATAGLAGHQKVIDEAKRRFAAYTKGNDKNAIHPSLRSAVFRIAITVGGREEYEAVKQEFTSTTSIDGKEIALQSLGRVQTAELAREFFDFLFSPAVAVQDVHSGAIALANNSMVRNTLWQLIKEKWDDTVHPKLSGNMVVFDRFLRFTLNKFASSEIADDIARFFEGKDNRGYDRSLGIIADTIRGYVAYKNRDRLVLKEWLGAHGYL